MATHWHATLLSYVCLKDKKGWGKEESAFICIERAGEKYEVLLTETRVLSMADLKRYACGEERTDRSECFRALNILARKLANDPLPNRTPAIVGNDKFFSLSPT